MNGKSCQSVQGKCNFLIESVASVTSSPQRREMDELLDEHNLEEFLAWLFGVPFELMLVCDQLLLLRKIDLLLNSSA